MFIIRVGLRRDYRRVMEPTPLTRALNWRDKGFRLLAWEADANAEILAIKVMNYRQREDIFNARNFVNRWVAFLNAWENFYMPNQRRNTSKEPRADQPFATKGFLERRLMEDEIRELDDWEATPVEIFDHMAAMTHEGIKITLTYKADTGTGICTLTDNRTGSLTQGYALSSFDVDCLRALKMAIYKYTTILATDWSPLLIGGVPARRG